MEAGGFQNEWRANLNNKPIKPFAHKSIKPKNQERKQIMKIRNIIANVLMLGIIFSLSSFKGNKWELLGVRTVDFKLDHDEILVSGFEGKFEAIKIKVNQGAINMRKVVVHFANGGSQEVEMKNNFKKGSSSRVIDLTGDDRVIRKVSLWYDTKNFSKKKAKVQVWGRH